MNEDPHLVRQHPRSVAQLRQKPLSDKSPAREKIAPPRYFEDSLGRRWFKLLEGRHAPGQMLFSRLLHPIVPVSDIIVKNSSKGHVFYSYHTPLQYVDSQKTTKMERLWEGAFFLWVMKDLDRGDGDNNMAMEHTGHAWFDLEAIPVFFMNPRLDGRADLFLTDRLRDPFASTNRDCVMNEGRMSDLTERSFSNWMYEHKNPKGISYLEEILKRAQTQWKDKEWVRGVVEGIVKKLKLPIEKIIHFPPSIPCKNFDCYFDYLYNTLIARVDNALHIVQQYEPDSAR